MNNIMKIQDLDSAIITFETNNKKIKTNTFRTMGGPLF